MKRLLVDVSKPYEVLVENNLLHNCGRLIAEKIKPCTIAIITDDTVNTLFGNEVEQSIQEAGFNVCRIIFNHGEASKNIDTLSAVLEQLAEHQITRTDLIVALGGGVVGDLAGFAAAVYLRGIRFVQIPTTFLAAIDSSVGGKTAVDLKAGKNLAGAFWQPELVLCDCETLMTLPNRYFLDGMGEAIKYGMAFDELLFKLFLQDDITAHMQAIVTRCIEIKAGIVAHDERDTGERRKLNFGHTVGHAIERCSNFSITHGHAVAIGMVIITRACVNKGMVTKECLESLIEVLTKCGLPVSCEYNARDLAKAALGDKKRSGDLLALVVPTKVGGCAMHDIAVVELEQWINLGLK